MWLKMILYLEHSAVGKRNVHSGQIDYSDTRRLLVYFNELSVSLSLIACCNHIRHLDKSGFQLGSIGDLEEVEFLVLLNQARPSRK